MTPKIKKVVTVRVKREDGRNYEPIRFATKEVECLDLDYGRDRRERQEKERNERNVAWRSMTPQQQLAELDRRLGEGVGAQKQRARIAKTMEDRASEKKEKQAKAQPKKQAKKPFFFNQKNKKKGKPAPTK